MLKGILMTTSNTITYGLTSTFGGKGETTAAIVGSLDIDGVVHAVINDDHPAAHLAVIVPHYKGGFPASISLARTGKIRKGGWVSVDITYPASRGGLIAARPGGDAWFKAAPADVHPADLSVRS